MFSVVFAKPAAVDGVGDIVTVVIFSETVGVLVAESAADGVADIDIDGVLVLEGVSNVDTVLDVEADAVADPVALTGDTLGDGVVERVGEGICVGDTVCERVRDRVREGDAVGAAHVATTTALPPAPLVCAGAAGP